MQAPIQVQFLHSPASSPRTSLPGSLDSTGTTLSSARSLSSRLPPSVSPVDPLHGSYTAALSALLPPNSFNRETRIKVATSKAQHRLAILQLIGFLANEDDIDAIKRYVIDYVIDEFANLRHRLGGRKKEKEQKQHVGLFFVTSLLLPFRS
jgi:hypothetical protein